MLDRPVVQLMGQYDRNLLTFFSTSGVDIDASAKIHFCLVCGFKLFLLNFERLVMWMSLSTALGRFPSFSLRSFLLVGRLELLRLCQYPGEFAYPMLEHNHIVSHQFHVFLRKVLDKECIQLSECIDNMQVRTLLLLIRLPFYSRHILCRWNIYNILYYIQVCSLLVDRFNMTLSYHLRNVIVLLISFDLFSG